MQLFISKRVAFIYTDNTLGMRFLSQKNHYKLTKALQNGDYNFIIKLLNAIPLSTNLFHPENPPLLGDGDTLVRATYSLSGRLRAQSELYFNMHHKAGMLTNEIDHISVITEKDLLGFKKLSLINSTEVEDGKAPVLRGLDGDNCIFVSMRASKLKDSVFSKWQKFSDKSSMLSEELKTLAITDFSKVRVYEVV